VACFSCTHGASFAQLSAGRVRTVLEAWADRARALAARPRSPPGPGWRPAAWHQAPAKDEPARHLFAAHLQVLSIRPAPGQLKYLAGTESGMGVWISDIAPEEAARRLRRGS
jgi:UDPglucose--hexose-1-phosphate uridylyltransferase